MKYIITESQYNNAIDKFITYHFEPHEEKIIDHRVIWIKNNNIIAEIQKSKYFLMYGHIWDSISNFLSLSYYDTKLVLTIWLEKHYGLGRLEPGIHALITGDFENDLENIKVWGY